MEFPGTIRGYFFFALLLAGLALFVASCSDTTSPSGQPGRISGSVTDTNGAPLPGAALMVSLRPSFDDILQHKSSGFFLDLVPADDLDRASILDPCGNQVRELCNGDCGANTTLQWDGLDDDGLRALEGLYYFEVAFPDTTYSHAVVLIHDYIEWDTESCRNNGLTDADGRYQLSDDCLGFGTQVTTTDEQGEIIDTRPIQRLVNLHLVTADGRVARRDSVRWPSEGSLTVDFVVAP